MNKHILIGDINAIERINTGDGFKWKIRVVNKWIEVPNVSHLFNGLKLQALIAKKVGVIAQFSAGEWDVHLKFLLENKTRVTVEIDEEAVADYAVKLGAPKRHLPEIVGAVEEQLKDCKHFDIKINQCVFELRTIRPDLFSDVRTMN